MSQSPLAHTHACANPLTHACMGKHKRMREREREREHILKQESHKKMYTLWHILLDFFYFCDNSYNLPSAYLVELPTIQRFWSLQIASGNLHVFDLYQVHPMQEMGFKLYFGELHLIEEFHLCCYISFDAIFSQGYQKILTKCFKVVTTNFVFSTDCFCPCTKPPNHQNLHFSWKIIYNVGSIQP